MKRLPQPAPRPHVGHITVASLLALLTDCERALGGVAIGETATPERLSVLCHGITVAVAGVHRRFGLWAPSFSEGPRTAAGVQQRFQEVAGSIRRAVEREHVRGDLPRLQFALDLSVYLTVFLCAIRRAGGNA